MGEGDKSYLASSDYLVAELTLPRSYLALHVVILHNETN